MVTFRICGSHERITFRYTDIEKVSHTNIDYESE